MRPKSRVAKITIGSLILLVCIFVIASVSVQPSKESNMGLSLFRPATALAADGSFLEQEAGIVAYVNTGQTIDIAKAKPAFRTVEKDTATYIIGSVALPGYKATEDVHVFVQQNGWIVAYYLKSEPTSKMIDWLAYSPSKMATKLQLGLYQVSDKLGLTAPSVLYYHFGYPSATKLMLITDLDSFKVTIPSGLQVYERSMSRRAQTVNIAWSIAIDARVWFDNGNYGSALEDRYWQVSAGQLTPDVSHTVSTWGLYGGDYYCLVLVYRE